MAAGTRARSGEAEQQVRGILAAAKAELGGAVALAYALKGAGIVGDKGEAYSESAISNWINGRSRPPADVLLAAAKLAGLDLNRYLNPEETGTDKKDREELAEVKREVKQLRESMMAELAHIHEEMSEAMRTRRAQLSAQNAQLDEGQSPT